MCFIQQLYKNAPEVLNLNEEKYSVLFDNEVEKKIPTQGTQSGVYKVPTHHQRAEGTPLHINQTTRKYQVVIQVII